MTNARFRSLILLLMVSAGVLAASVAGADEAYPKSPPGVVIDHIPARDGQYVGSPSIAVLPEGRYVASHDIFGPKSTFSRTRVFESADGGQTWRQISEIDGAFWSTLFVQRGGLYLIGTTERYGDTVIRRSTDGGRTWTAPADARTGLLQSGGGYHCAPQPVLVHKGRIWRAMEDNRGGKGWAKHFRAIMLSAPLDADLLDATNWTISNALPSDLKWLDGKFNGWLEGNAVAAPDGHVVNVLRVDVPGGYGKAAIVDVSEDGKTASFDPSTGFIDMPGGSTKFTIRFDPVSKYYWSLSNSVPERHVDQGRAPGAIRNTLALVRSSDLRRWEVRAVVAYHHDVKHHGFQYPDWQFAGEDIVAVARTAYDDGLGGAHNFHDANYLTFHRIRDFRGARGTELPPLPPPETITAECDDFRATAINVRIATLAENGAAYGNRKYVWKNVPARFAGWHYTQTDGGVTATIEVLAKRDATLFMATAPKHIDVGQQGWSLVPESTFYYTDGAKTELNVYSRPVKKGQTITIPQGGWTGGLLLIPADGQPTPETSKAAAVPTARPNVLFIAVDDLRVELGCYGDTLAKSPNIDRLAARGIRFTRAYCQQSLCNPSRASILTGLRPDTLGVWDLLTHFRVRHPDIVTLPQLFKQHGYHTRDIGKIFHNYRQDDFKGDPASWSVPATLHYGSHYVDDKVQVDGDAPPNLATLEKTECRDVPDEAYLDGRVAAEAMKALREVKDRPFFLAVGFWKPHLPFNAPKKYWDLYDRSEVELPPNPERPKDVPEIALQDYKIDSKEHLTDDDVRQLRHGHYAAISYLDAQVGKVLDELDRLGLRDKTIVVFWSDHGLHLGEHGLWSKTTCFELDAHVPLIIATPDHRGGQHTDALVELLDLYPTLADLCGLPAPGGLEGVSLRPVLGDVTASVKSAAFSQHPRPPYCRRADPQVMGYSIRTDRYRYNEWLDFKTGRSVARELYDHASDPRETVNLAGRDESAEIIRRLASQLDTTLHRVVPTPQP